MALSEKSFRISFDIMFLDFPKMCLFYLSENRYMNQQNDRKEPTFGNKVSQEKIAGDNSQIDPQKLSLHSEKAPSFTFTPVLKRAKEDENSQLVEQVDGSSKEEENKESDMEQPTESSTAPERVIPVTTTKNNWNKPEEWGPLKKVPSKHRRLVVVILLLLLLLIIFFLLKPKSPETVEELQQQGSSLPIEFRPVDEAEAKAEEARLAAEKIAVEQAEKKALENPKEQAELTHIQNEAVKDELSKTEMTQPQINTVTSVENPPRSVIYQPETTQQKVILSAPKVVKSHTEAPVARKVEKPIEKKAVAKIKPEVTKSAPVVVAKPVKSVDSSATMTTKTMAIPAGVSLMQVFRNHNLNISDVNAMTKATGANKVLSSFKPGDKVNVQLDNHNRVVVMALSSGGRFIRQPNGGYIYKK